MRLFSKKEIDKKKNDSLAVTAKKGLDIAKEMDKNLKALEVLKQEKQQLNESYEELQEETQTKRRALQIEIENLRAVREQEMKPVTALLVEAANKLKDVERQQSDLEQREIALEKRSDTLKDDLDIIAGRWGEARVMEANLQKRSCAIINEEARISNKDKLVTSKLEELNKKSLEYSEMVKIKETELSLKKNEVDAYWKAIAEKKEEMKTQEKKLQVWEYRLAAHQKRLNK